MVRLLVMFIPFMNYKIFLGFMITLGQVINGKSRHVVP